MGREVPPVLHHPPSVGAGERGGIGESVRPATLLGDGPRLAPQAVTLMGHVDFWEGWVDVGEEGDLEWYLALHVLSPGHRFDYSFLISAVHKVLAVTRSTRSKDVLAAVQQFYRGLGIRLRIT